MLRAECGARKRRRIAALHTLGISLLEITLVCVLVAIAAIVALIQWRAAHVRRNVAAVHTDFAEMARGIEAYRADLGVTPRNTWRTAPWFDKYAGLGHRTEPIFGTLGPWITTPVAYLPRFEYLDPFMEGSSGPVWVLFYTYGDLATLRFLADSMKSFPAKNLPLIEREFGAYFLLSYGPDKLGGGGGAEFYVRYDPTNGTVSGGNIIEGEKDKGQRTRDKRSRKDDLN